jgi:hypothetical protein
MRKSKFSETQIVAILKDPRAASPSPTCCGSVSKAIRTSGSGDVGNIVAMANEVTFSHDDERVRYSAGAAPANSGTFLQTGFRSLECAQAYADQEATSITAPMRRALRSLGCRAGPLAERRKMIPLVNAGI